MSMQHACAYARGLDLTENQCDISKRTSFSAIHHHTYISPRRLMCLLTLSVVIYVPMCNISFQTNDEQRVMHMSRLTSSLI